MDKLEKSIEPLKKIANSIVAVATGPGGAVTTVKQLYEIFRSAKELANTWSSSEPEVPNWVLKMQIEINEQNLKKGLPLQRLSRKIMLLTDVEGMSNDDLQKLVHKRGFVILDAQKQLNDGVEPYGWFKDGVKDLEAHRQAMKRVRDQSARIIANKIRAHKEDTKKPFNKLDVLVIGEDFGAQAGKEGIDYLIQKYPQLLDSLGYVELLALNHVAVTSAGPSPNLYHNDTRPFAYFLTQYYENETDVPNGFKKGPLDGKESGSYAAIDNGLVRNFSSADPVGAKRFRNFSSEGKFVSENVQFVGKRDDGLLIMINETGNLSIMDSVKQTRVIDTKVFASGFTIGKLAPDGSKLAMLGDGGTLVVMDIATKQVSNRIKLGQGCVDLVWSSDGNAIVVGRQNGALENVVIRNNVLLSPVLLANTTKGLLRFWIQEKQVITYHNDGSLQLWGLNNKTTPILILRSNLGSKVTAIDFSKNGELVVARGAVVDVYQLKDASWNLKITLSDNRNDIKAIAFSADGTTLALGGEDCQLRTYSLPALREGTRLVMATYNPPMLPIKQIALSGNGQELSVSYRMHVGGRVIDRDISEDIARDVKILDHLRDDERKIAKRLPEVVVDKYMNQLRFFERKDRADLEQQYGYSSKMANWKMAQYSQATDDLLRFQADGEEGTGATDGSLQPEIQKRIGFQKINDGFTLSLSSYVSHLNAEGVQINVSSMDPGVVEITRQENVMALSPVSEGRTMINVTIDFPGGSYDLSFITEVSAEPHRAKIEALKQELARLKRETSAADQASDAVQKMVNRREDNIDAFAKEADAYAKRVAKAEAELKKEIDAQSKFLAQRDNISKSTKESRELLEKNLSTSETLSKQLDQAEADVRSQNGRVKDLRGAVNAARDRLDRATKAQRDARRRELDAAVANLSSAENQLSSLQAVKRDIDKRLGDCLDTVASLRKRISNLSEDLKNVERRVEQSAKEINKLSKNLAEISAPKALVDQKKRLENNIATDIKSVSEMFSTIKERSSRMQTVLNEFKRIESMKWIKGLGLERLMREEVNPVLKQMGSHESQVTSMQKQLQRQQKLVQGFDLN
jgi:WD40 repeat protein/predicted  nucleic acid-binding Zn-ribbon protein